MIERDERIEKITAEMNGRFGGHGEPRWFRAPGRVDVMGSHTDYNQGFILASTIDRDIMAAARPRKGGVINLYSLNTGQEVRIHRDHISFDREHGWANYPKGVIKEILEQGVELDGLDLVFHGDVPVGGNLSSSAALEAATCEAALGIAGAELPIWEKVHLCRRAENGFLGMPCGIMDQFSVIMGKQDAVLKLDCRDLQYDAIPFPAEAALVVIDSGQGRELVASEYAKRVEECQAAVKALAAGNPRVKSLRDAAIADLEPAKARMNDVIFRRARHVISENDRVNEAAQALLQNDLAALGRIMEAGYRSCRDDYENSHPQLDLLHDLAQGLPGLLGLRVCGAGWGGCVLALVQAAAADEFSTRLLAKYRDKSAVKGDAWIVKPSAGAGPA